MARGNKTQRGDTSSSSKNQKNRNGCLIDFEDTRIGDILFHISRGEVEVTHIERNDSSSNFTIGFKYLESKSRDGDNSVYEEKEEQEYNELLLAKALFYGVKEPIKKKKTKRT